MPRYLRNPLPYNRASIDSIVVYAKTATGKTLRQVAGINSISSPINKRGSYGLAIEEHFFFYEPNNSPEPDFPEAGLELKTTPVVKGAKGTYRSKERLVISMIDYFAAACETWETSSLSEKLHKILLMFYEYNSDVNPVDYPIVLADVWQVPEEDLPTFKEDFNIIVSKIRNGKAHELSGSDTTYLEACTKASNSSVRREQPYSSEPAKPRAWAIKASYMTTVFNHSLKHQPIKRDPSERQLGLPALIRKRFEPYFGKSEQELAEQFGYMGSRKPKNLCALITKRILGVEDDAQIAEFEKAGIKPKTIRLLKSGKPKESISFPHFDYCEVAATEFEDSEFYEQVQQKYLFVLFEEDPNDSSFRLSDTVIWQMPERDIPNARSCYETMRKRIQEGRADDSVKSTENPCCHVRPHGRDSGDVLITPSGNYVVKKSFWFNASYIANEIRNTRG